MDDGHVPKFKMEDVKAFLTVGFARQIDCRYWPIKIAKNAFSAVVDNTWDKRAEPAETSHGGRVPWDVFYGMLKPSLAGIAEDDMLAILKRTVVMIGGYRAVYLRLPSESKSEPITMYTRDAVAKDWFQKARL